MSAAAGALKFGIEPFLTADELFVRHEAVFEDDLGRVRRADPELLLLLALTDPLVVLTRDDEARLAADAERRIDGGDDDVDVGETAVRGEDLLSVEDPPAVDAFGLRPEG